MRPRLRPRTALAVAVSCAIALGTAASLHRGRAAEGSSARPALASIDATLRRDSSGCAGVRSTVWHPLSGIEYTGRLDVTLPAFLGGAIVFFIGHAVPLDVEALLPDGSPVLMHRERVDSVLAAGVPPDYWLQYGTPWLAPPRLTRALVDALGDRDLTFTLALGSRGPRVLARLIGYPPDVRVPVCAAPVSAGEPYFATGWFGSEAASGTGAVRWMREDGIVIVSSQKGGGARVRVRAAPAVPPDASGTTRLTLRVNGVFETSPVPMTAGFHEYEWMVPDRAWVGGANELWFTVSRTEQRGWRTVGLALAELSTKN